MGKLILIALGGFALYEYFYGQSALPITPVSTTQIPPLGTSAAQPGFVSDPGQTPVVPANSVSSTSLISSTVQTQLQQLAAADLAANPGQGGLTLYQWMYYYQQVTGTNLFGTGQGEKMVQAVGLNDQSANTTIIPFQTFLGALSSNGLSGLNFMRGLGLVSGIRGIN